MVELVKKAKKGNKDSFALLVEQVKDKAYKVAFTYLKNKEDSLDAVYDGVVTAYSKIHTLKKAEYFETWFIRIVINCCKMQLRDRKKCDKIVEVLQERNSLYKEEKYREEIIILHESLMRMKPLDRKIIHMKFTLGYKIKDISEILNMQESAVKNKIYRGVKKLREDVL